jgi:hypothetical protein
MPCPLKTFIAQKNFLHKKQENFTVQHSFYPFSMFLQSQFVSNIHCRNNILSSVQFSSCTTATYYWMHDQYRYYIKNRNKVQAALISRKAGYYKNSVRYSQFSSPNKKCLRTLHASVHLQHVTQYLVHKWTAGNNKVQSVFTEQSL